MTQTSPAVHPPSAPGGRFVFLDGLRGLASLWVVLFHFVNRYVSPMPDQLAAILPRPVHFVLSHGDLGVEIFFVLSGFVIIHSIFGEAITLPYAGNFVVRRTLRLGPPYWVMVLFHMFWAYFVFPTWIPGFFETWGGWKGLLINFAYLPDLLGWPRLVDVAWTLALEVQFYIAFIAMMALAYRLSAWFGRRAAIASLIVISVPLAGYSLFRWFAMHDPKTGGHLNDFPARWFMFFTGALVYWTIRDKFPRWAMWVYLAGLAAGSLVTMDERGGMTVATAVLVLVATALKGQQTWLAYRPVQYLAKISYSLFLVHVPLGSGAAFAILKFGDKSTICILTALGVGVAVSIVAAHLMHAWVEAPALRLTRKLKRA